jgi:putative endonuclease
MTRKRRKVATRKAEWFLYILECCDGSLYAGISNDVQARLAAHQAGRGAKYTRAHLPVTLRYVEKCGTRGEAMKRECKVKKLTRGKKLELVSQES